MLPKVSHGQLKMSNTTAYQPPQLGRKGCFGVAILGCTLCICLLLGTCVSRVVVTQVDSPDGSLVASVTETNGGATTDFGYEVDIARNWPLRWSHSVAGFYGAGRSDCAYGVNVRWIGNNTLLISYKDARSADADKAAYLLGRTVRVITKAGVNDPAAPCGGMEYSQHAR
jgi:hypothetical protein